jgi:hypothetical protein
MALKSVVTLISRNHPFDRIKGTTSHIGDFSTGLRTLLLTAAILLGKILKLIL